MNDLHQIQRQIRILAGYGRANIYQTIYLIKIIIIVRLNLLLLSKSIKQVQYRSVIT